MAYVKTLWNNGGAPGISAEKLNNIENGIETSDSDIGVHKGNLANPHAVTKTQVGLANVDNVQQVPLSQKGVANGVASLDTAGIVFGKQLGHYIASDAVLVLVPGSFTQGNVKLSAGSGDFKDVYTFYTPNKGRFRVTGSTVGYVGNYSSTWTAAVQLEDQFGNVISSRFVNGTTQTKSFTLDTTKDIGANLKVRVCFNNYSGDVDEKIYDIAIKGVIG